MLDRRDQDLQTKAASKALDNTPSGKSVAWQNPDNGHAGTITPTRTYQTAQAAGAKVVLVMGHTACGAIKGAIEEVQLGNLTGLLAKIQPAAKATSYQGDRSAKNNTFVDAVARKNVELTMESIRKGNSVLSSRRRAPSTSSGRCMISKARKWTSSPDRRRQG